jgi:hypothetical protein
MHFNFPQFHPRKIEVYISHKCIYRKDSVKSSIHQLNNGLLRAKNSRLLCLDDEPKPLEPEPKPEHQDQEIVFSSEYDETEYHRNRNTGSSNTRRYKPSNH